MKRLKKYKIQPLTKQDYVNIKGFIHSATSQGFEQLVLGNAGIDIKDWCGTMNRLYQKIDNWKER